MIKINKNNSTLLNYLNKGYSLKSALTQTMHKSGYYFNPDEIDIREFKKTYHVYLPD